MLASQQFTIVRREANLEKAMLDGVLTATLQPEGLQVGDVVDFAMSLTSRVPALGTHVEQIGGGWNGIPFGRVRLRAQWPAALPIRYRQSEGLPAAVEGKAGSVKSVELAVDNLQPFSPPNGAPPRFLFGRLVEMSDFKDWSELGALMAPLYAKAAALPATGPLRDELKRITGLSPDPKLRAEAALALVQDKIRYVFLGMDAGSYVPADAATTWSRRFGDCKGKTALLLALLDALGIEAAPVAVSSALGDGLDQRLPMVGLFDHVLVRATIKGRSYWLDGTRTGDRSLDALRVPNFGWGLPLVPKGATLVRLVPPPLDLPSAETAVTIDATAGILVAAPIRATMVLRGDAALGLNLSLANLTPDMRDQALRAFWREQYDFVEVGKTSAAYDPATAEERLSMEGSATMKWRDGWYETDGTGLGYDANFHRESGPNRDAPFAVNYPFYIRNSETILLPESFGIGSAKPPAAISKTIAGVEYRRRVEIAGNAFKVEATQRSIAPEFPASEAAAAQAELRKLNDDRVYLRRPDGYRPNEKEVTAALQAKPATVDEFLERGYMMLEANRMDDAIADFTQALAIDPKNAPALANRGIAHVWKRELKQAGSDLDAAATLDPRNAVMFRGRGLLEEFRHEPVAAVAAYTSALEVEPRNGFAVGHRAFAHRAAGNPERAFEDAGAAIKLSPGWAEMYLLRINILRDRKQKDQALAEAAALVSANPDQSYAYIAAAKAYAAFGQQDEAMGLYDRAIANKPEAYIYLNRALTRPKEDTVGRLADLDAALKLEPKLADAIDAKARLRDQMGDHAGALRVWSEAIAAAPENSLFLLRRGVAYARAGRQALADKDFAAARVIDSGANGLNDICWEKAIAGVALQSALADCDAALAKAPGEAAYLDSRGLVLLKLGRIDDAIADYDKALTKAPTQSSSLYGRAIARAKKGDQAQARVDADAALKIDANVRSVFEEYGLKL